MFGCLVVLLLIGSIVGLFFVFSIILGLGSILSGVLAVASTIVLFTVIMKIWEWFGDGGGGGDDGKFIDSYDGGYRKR